MSVYADTSFLVSLYVLDANSELAAARMARTPLPLMVTLFGELELTNAISLRLFRREIVPLKARAARALVAKDLADGVLLARPLPPTVFERARQIARQRTPRFGTRTLDVLHVASALLLQADTFYTFDRSQGKLAAAERLAVP